MEEFKNSDALINKNESQMVGSIYEALTFSETSPVDLDLISASINEFGLEQTYISLLEKWYHSAIYTYYDFSNYKLPALSLYNVSGKVQASNNQTISGASLEIFYLSGTKINETFSNQQGEFSLRMKVADMLIGEKIKLIISFDGYGKREIIITIPPEKNIIQNIIINPLGKITESIGGQITSSNNDIRIQIPPGAVTTDAQFNVSNIQMQSVPELSESEGAIFEIDPGYVFSKPIYIYVNIESLTSKYPDQKNWIVFQKKDGELWGAVTDILYNQNTKVIQIRVNHFSSFFISPVSQKISQSEYDSRAEVFEKKTITYPTEIPSLLPYAKQKLQNGGWDPSVVDGIEFIEESGCNEKGTVCNPIQRKEDIYDSSSGVTISGLATVTGTANFDIQAEQCKINPYFSTPQLRLNRISGTNISLNTRLDHDIFTIKTICFRDKYIRIPYPSISCSWRSGCSIKIRYKTISIKVPYTCSYTISAESDVIVNNYNAGFARSNNSSNYEWIFTGHSNNDPEVIAYIDNDFWIEDLIEEMYFGISIPIIKTKVIKTLRETLASELNTQKNEIRDPNFDERYCDLFSAPQVWLLSNQHYYVTYFPDGYNSSEITWKSDLDVDYVIKANGSCESNSSSLEVGSAKANTPVISKLHGYQLTEGLNTIHICVTRQYHYPGEKTFTMVRDDVVPRITFDTTQSNYREFVSNSGGFNGTSLSWQTDYNGFYEVKINSECKTIGNNILNGGSGYAIVGTQVISTINANELSDGWNPINVCVRARNGLIGVETQMIFRDDIAPITNNSPISGLYDHSQNIILSCEDQNCLKTAYTTDGGNPLFNINGEIINGALYTAPWSTPDPAITTLKFRSIDRAGNIENVKEAVYTVDSVKPEAKITFNEKPSLSVADDILESKLVWTSSREGLEYSIQKGGTNCGNGEIIETGITALGEMISYIPADKLDINSDNTIRICVKNLIGNFNDPVTFTINRYEKEPSIIIHEKSRYFISRNSGYSDSTILWSSNQRGTYKIKVNGKCNDNTILPSYSGEMNANESISVTIDYTNLLEESNIIRICATNIAGLSNEEIDILYLDNRRPFTLSSINGGTFGLPQEVALSCTDTIGCDSIIYTINGSDPEFPDNGIVVHKPIGEKNLSAKITIGADSDGTYFLKYRSKDISGNIEEIKTATFTINRNLPSAQIEPDFRNYLSINGYTKTNLIWKSNRDGTYSIKAGNSCEKGIDLNLSDSLSFGNMYSGVPLNLSINAFELDGGRNTIRICVTDTNNQFSEGVFILTRDDTPPSTTNFPGEGAYGSIQDINLICSNNCKRTIYTTDGQEPEFDTEGNIIHGIEYAGAWATPHTNLNAETITTFKFRSIDEAGNIEEIKTAAYIIDPEVPTISIISNQYDIISNTPGFDYSNLIWKVLDREGLEFSVEVGEDSCGFGLLINDSSGNGIISGNNISSKVVAPDLSTGENKIKICVPNRLGKYGYTTYNIYRNDSTPGISFNSKQYEVDSVVYLSINGYTYSSVNWESSEYGAYSVKINGDCSSENNSTGYHNSGDVNQEVPVTSSLLAEDLANGENSVRVCVKGENRLVGSSLFTAIRDDDPPQTSVNPPGWFYKTTQNVTLSCTDNSAGCKKIIYTTNNTTPSIIPQNGTTILGDSGSLYLSSGNSILRYFSKDNAGNAESEKISRYRISSYGFIYVGSEEGLYVSTDFGFSFSKTMDKPINKIFIEYPNVYLLGKLTQTDPQGEALFISKDLGNSFSEYQLSDYSSPHYFVLRDIYANDSSVYIAKYGGIHISNDYASTFVYRTVNNGLISNYVNNISADGPLVCLGYYFFGDGISISADFGNSFSDKTTINGLGSNFVNDIFCKDNKVYVATDNGLSVSTNSGASFTNKDSFGEVLEVLEVWVENSKIYVTNTEGLHISSDGGNTFTLVTIGNSFTPKTIFANGNNVLVSDVFSNIYISTDGGYSFTPSDNFNHTMWFIKSLSFVP